MAVGDIGRWRDSAGGQIPGTAYGAMDFATQERNDGSTYSKPNNSTVQFNEAGLFMLRWVIQQDDSSNNRTNGKTRAVQAVGSGDFFSTYHTGYSRNSSNRVYSMYGRAFINAAVNDQVQIQDIRDTDAPTGGSLADASFLEVVKLGNDGDFDYAIYQQSTGNQSYGGTTPNDVAFGAAPIETDTASIELQANDTDIRLKRDNARYWLIYSVSGDAGGSRTQRVSRAVSGSTLVPGSGSYAYQRNTSNEFATLCGEFFHEIGAGDEDVSVQVWRGDGILALQGGADVDGSWNSIAAETTCLVIDMPDSWNTAAFYDSVGGDQFPTVTLDAFTDTLWADSPYTRNSNIQMTADAGDHLAIGSTVTARNDVGSGARMTAGLTFAINATPQTRGEHKFYTRGNQGSQDTFGGGALCSGMFDNGAGTLAFQLRGIDRGDNGAQDLSRPDYTAAFFLDLDNLDVGAGGPDVTASGAGTIAAPTASGTAKRVVKAVGSTAGGAITVDDSTVARWTGTPVNTIPILSASFTPPANSLIVVCVEADGSGAQAQNISVSGGGLSWFEQVSQTPGANNGYAGIFTAEVGPSPTSFSISVVRNSGAGATNRISAKAYIVEGQAASPIGASVATSSTTNNVSQLVSCTGPGRLFGAGNDWNALGTPSSTNVFDAADYSGQISVIDVYRATDHTAGLNSLNFDAAGAGAADWNIAALEILADAGGSGVEIASPTASGNASIPSGETASGAAGAPLPTASGSALVRKQASGAATAATVTGSGAAAVRRVASGAATLAAATASGTASVRKTASGAATIAPVEASGAAGRTLAASGTASIPAIEASGNATVGAVVQASGAASISPATASGGVALTRNAAGNATAPAAFASGTATIKRFVDASGNPEITALTAAGTAASIGVPNTFLRVTFPTPSLPVAGTQKFRVYARKHLAGGADPTITAELWLAGAFDRVISTSAAITSAVGELIEFETEYSGSGADVELRLIGNAAGLGASRRTVEFGAVEWCVLFASNPSASGAASITPVTASGSIALTRSASGASTAPLPTASGSALVRKAASGAATIAAVTASGTANITKTVSASGAASTPSILASGSVALRRFASGAATIPSSFASGSAQAGQIKSANGAATITPITATGSAALTRNASGSATAPAATAAGSSLVARKASGSATITPVTATGSARVARKASGAATITPVTASGSVRLVFRTSGAATMTPVISAGSAIVGGVQVQSEFRAIGRIIDACLHGRIVDERFTGRMIEQHTASKIASEVKLTGRIVDLKFIGRVKR